MLWSNATLNEAKKVSFKPYEWLRESCATASAACTADFVGWYFQLPVGERVQPYLAVRTSQGCFAHARGPMGHKWMVFVAQTLTKVLAWDPFVQHDVMIDNVMYLGDVAMVERAREGFIRRCESIGQPPWCRKVSEVVTEVEHRGLVWNVTTKSAKLKESWRNKAIDRTRRLIEQPTAGRLWSLGGMMAWARRFCPDVEGYGLWKAIAAASRGRPERQVELSVEVRRDIAEWMRWVSTDPEIHLHPQEAEWDKVLIVTDASLTRPLGRWGAIIVTDHVTTYTGLFPIAWCKVVSIADLETAAAVLACRLYFGARPLSNKNITLLTDNQTTQKVIAKKRSRSWRLHQLQKILRELVNTHNSFISCVWIPTANNPADGLSRGKNYTDEDHTKVKRFCAEIGMELEERNLTKENIKDYKELPLEGTRKIDVKWTENVLINVLGNKSENILSYMGG
jgi:hypothetical protein